MPFRQTLSSSILRCLALLAGSLPLATATATAPAAQAPADTVFVGTIVTMDAAAPRAEAVAIRGEKILAVGAREAVLRHRGPGTRVVELGERALLPGFIDTHGHLTGTAASLRFANLSPAPVGSVGTIGELQEALRRFILERGIPPGEWVVGRGYDDAQLSERRHPTRDDLDAVSREHPIYIVHASGHLGAANSTALVRVDYGAATPDPAGGVIRRRAGSREPDGVLEETAHMAVFGQLPRAGLEESLAELPRALAYYASFGLTTVQDGAAAPEALALLREADRRGLLTLDVVAYRFWTPVGASFPEDPDYGTARGRVKLGGIKLMLDGSPQGKTAWLSQPYLVPPAGQPATYSGYPTLPPAAVTKAVTEALQRDVAVIAHANGDAASEALVEAVRAARAATGRPGPLVVMIHAQTVRDDQLDRMAALGMIPSFFTGHTFYWGDWHRDQTLGLPRAERISPARSALERGLAFTLHTDAPVVPPDMIRTLWSATTRRTRSGDILGPAQRIGIAEALAGLTVNAARQYGEADRKGAIRAGLLADLVILSRDPLGVDPESLRDLSVVETISRGRTVYRQP